MIDHKTMLSVSSAVTLSIAGIAARADTITIGQELTNRSLRDGGSGNLFGAEAFGFDAGTVRRWSIRGQTATYAETRNITPLILEQTGGGGVGSVTVRGIGTTRALAHSTGVQTFDFGLQSGSERMGPRHYFGWVDGDGTGPVNQGTMSYDEGDQHYTLWFGGRGVVTTGAVYAVSRNLNRRYSLQVAIDVDRGEAVGNGANQRAAVDGASGATFVLANPFAQAGHVTQWAFWSGTDGTRSVTPLILERAGGNLVLRGVGTTRTAAANQGTMTYDFGLQSGTNAVKDSQFFGWVDASVDYATGDPSNNRGVVTHATDELFDCKVIYLGAGKPAGTFLPGQSLGAGTLLDRAYSVQALSVIPVGGALTVSSPYGTPDPSGTRGYFPGSGFTASVVEAVTSGTTQYVCTGWSGSGSAPLSGTTNAAVFTITNDSALAWQWGTNYYLDITANPGGTTDVHSAFFAVGTNVTVTAYPTNNAIGANWSGDVDGCTIVSNRITCPMDRPRVIVADFPSLADGLMAYWNLDEGDATIVLDPYGNVGDAGALAGGTASPTWIDGKVGANALGFSGSNFATAAYSSDIGLLTGSSITSAVTIQAWVFFNSNAPGAHDILDKRPAANTGGWTLEIDGDNLSWWINNGGGGGDWNLCRATGAIPGWEGQWVHLVLTWQSGTKMKMVVNDTTTFESETPVGGTVFFRNDVFYFGARVPGNNRFLDGAIDEVAIWSRALSAGEITALYNGGEGRPVVSGLRAADVSSVAVAQEGDVRGAGVTLLAKSFGADSGVGAANGGTVNGITFPAAPGTNHAEFTSAANSAWGTYDASTSLSGDLDSIFSGTLGLDDLGASPNRRSVLTLSGLEVGTRYRLQWLSAAEGQTAGFWTFRNSDQGDVIATVGRHPNRNTRIAFRATNTTQSIHVQEVPTAAPLINAYVLQQVQTIRPTVHAYSPGWNRLPNLVNGTTPNPADANFAVGFDRTPAGDLKSDDAYNVHGGGPSAQGQAYALTNTNPWLVFDLGEPVNLASLLLWNGNQQTDRQARSFDVRVSATNDFSAATLLSVSHLPNRPLSGVMPADAIDLSELGGELAGARYVRLDNFVNYGDPEFVVLSEVRFEVTTAVPQPEGMLIIVQ